MGRVAAVGKGTFNPGQNDFAHRRQSFSFIAGKIDNQYNRGAINRGGTQQPQIPGLDHPAKVVRCAGKEFAVLDLKQGLVIGYQTCTQGHKPERERRFPRA